MYDYWLYHMTSYIGLIFTRFVVIVDSYRCLATFRFCIARHRSILLLTVYIARILCWRHEWGRTAGSYPLLVYFPWFPENLPVYVMAIARIIISIRPNNPMKAGSYLLYWLYFPPISFCCVRTTYTLLLLLSDSLMNIDASNSPALTNMRMLHTKYNQWTKRQICEENLDICCAGKGEKINANTNIPELLRVQHVPCIL